MILFFDALDQIQAGDPHGGNLKPLACEINCLRPKFRTLLRDLQKQQGAFMTLACNTHLLDLKPSRPGAGLRQIYMFATPKRTPLKFKRDRSGWKGGQYHPRYWPL